MAGKGWRAKVVRCELQGYTLLGLAAAGVSHEERAVVGGEDVLRGEVEQREAARENKERCVRTTRHGAKTNEVKCIA